MYCFLPLVLGFIAGRNCGFQRRSCGCGRRCCPPPPPNKCFIVNCHDRRY